MFVVGTIESWIEQGNRRDSVAILYRSNAQSRVFEEQLLSAGMPLSGIWRASLFRTCGNQRRSWIYATD